MAMLIPHDVFKHILSFKDPTKQVGVKGGIKAPSCVWYTWNQRRLAPRGAIILKYSDDRLFFSPTSWIDNQALHVYEKHGWRDHLKYFALWKTRSRYWHRDDDRALLSEADETCPTRLVEMSLQCEACEPDLELYNVIRG